MKNAILLMSKIQNGGYFTNINRLIPLFIIIILILGIALILNRNKKFKHKKKFINITIVIIILILPVTLLLVNGQKKDIDKILTTKDYSYLPNEAKDYIREVYSKTGNILDSEKSKKTNQPYLNPLYAEYLALSDAQKKEIEVIPNATVTDYNKEEKVEDVTLPSKYDLRDVDGKNFVTPVRDQGNLSLCWTFATAGSIESYLLKKQDKSYDNNAMLISERQIDYATATNGLNDYQSEYVSFIKRQLGGGGNYYISTVAMANGISLFNYNNFKKYNDTDFSSMEISDVLSFNKSEYEVNSTNTISSPNLRLTTDKLTDEEKNQRNAYINEIKSEIIKYGAAYVSTSTANGCYYDDKKLDNMVIDVYNCDRLAGNHAMEVIGWNDDIEYSYCSDSYNGHDTSVESCSEHKIVKGKGVWILKNSWGEQYPYPYLTYDSLYTTVNFTTNMNQTTAGDMKHDPENEWKHNYILGSNEGFTVDSKEVSMSSTKIPDSEELRKIKFFVETYNSKFDIIIKDDMGKKYSITKTNEMPGLVTVDVPYDIYINKNSTIKISSKEGQFIDKIMVFTGLLYDNPIVYFKGYGNQISSPKTRLYQEFRKVSSGSTIEYKLYDSDNNDVTSLISYTNNIVAENNVNPLFDFSQLSSGKYKLDTIYEGKIINTDNIEYLKMAGTGTKGDPYVIMTPYHLAQIREDLDAYYILGADIDMTSVTRTGGGLSNESKLGIGAHGWIPIYDFSGTLDGRGHTIKGLYQRIYLESNNKYSYSIDNYHTSGGLFGTISGNITIENLNIEDFDIEFTSDNPSGLSFGGVLFGSYASTTACNVTIKNISVKNSKVTGISHRRQYSNASSLFGIIRNVKGNVDISNIYIDAEVESSTQTISFMADEIINSAGNVNINNIQLFGKVSTNYEYNPKIAVFPTISGFNCNISNIFSNVKSNIDNNSFIDTIYYGFNDEAGKGTLNLKNVYVINNGNTTLINGNQFESYGISNVENVNLYQRGVNTNELSEPSQYRYWDNFDKYWSIQTINNIKRYPMLKIANNKYTDIADISIKQELNKKYYIFDYITPNINIAKDIIYKSSNEKIVKIDDTGRIIPISSGTATIHIESLYDGYIKDVPIKIEYKPHYTIKFEKNSDATGEMEDVEVDINDDYIVENKFEREYYDFTGWSTTNDGSNNQYKDGLVTKQKDKTVITLYAQWKGKKSTITFEPNGGIVNPTSIDVYYGEPIGQLPIPTKDGYGFSGYESSLFPNIVISSQTFDKAGYYKDGLTLTAIWVPDAYTIIYHPNNDILLDYDDSSYGRNNQNETLEKNRYKKEGYIFKEWNTKADGTGQSYADKAVIKLNNVPNSVLDLYAIWEPISYILTTNANFPDGGYLQQTLIYDKPEKILKNTFSREGYTFKEWNTKPDGTGTAYSDEQIILNLSNIEHDTIDLYAQWIESFSYKIETYEHDEENKYITSIQINTTVDEYLSHIKLNKSYSIKVDSKKVNNKQVIYTGSKTKIFKDNEAFFEYTNIIFGDTNGDGRINYLDYVNVYNHIQKVKNLGSSKKLLTNEYAIAADFNKDNKINYLDYVKIYNKIKELKGGSN